MIAFARNNQWLQQEESLPQEESTIVVDEATVDPRLNTNARVRELLEDLSCFD